MYVFTIFFIFIQLFFLFRPFSGFVGFILVKIALRVQRATRTKQIRNETEKSPIRMEWRMHNTMGFFVSLCHDTHSLTLFLVVSLSIPLFRSSKNLFYFLFHLNLIWNRISRCHLFCHRSSDCFVNWHSTRCSLKMDLKWLWQ